MKWGWWVLVPLALTSACGKAADLSTTSAPKVQHDIVRETVALPARYAAGVPASVADFEAWPEDRTTWIPQTYARDMLTFGDAAVFDRVEQASRRVASSESEAWARSWFQLLRHVESTPEFCARARTTMRDNNTTLRKALAGAFATACTQPEDVELIVRDDTPGWAVLAFYDQAGERTTAPPFSDRLVASVQEAMRVGTTQDARIAAFILARQLDPRAARALLDLHRDIADTDRADQVAMAFLRGNDPEGRAIAGSACQRRAEDPMCERPLDVSSHSTADDPEKPPVEAVRAQIAKLQSLGFARATNLDPDTAGTVDAVQLLLQAGHAHWFDVETGMYPNGHDSLMRALARLVGPDLDGVVFEETPPDSDEDLTPYELSVYSDGTRYRVPAENLGDWYDVDTVLRLMNRVLADRQSHQRLVMLATDDQTATIVGAPVAVLRAAFKQGVLTPGDPTAAEQAGKGFEEQVLDSLVR